MCREADRRVVMRSPCADAALDPPLWIVPNKALSLSLSEPPCACEGLQQGQTESGGIVLAVICWAPSAQRRCYPTRRCTYRPSDTFSHISINFSLSLSLSLCTCINLDRRGPKAQSSLIQARYVEPSCLIVSERTITSLHHLLCAPITLSLDIQTFIDCRQTAPPLPP